MEFLKKINQEDGVTMIANLHHVDLALKYATRIVGIKGGEVVYDIPATVNLINKLLKI